MVSAESFMVGGVDLLCVADVGRRENLEGIIGKVHGFPSIATRRATSELIALSSFFGEVQKPTPSTW